jgi:peptide/nickel transport system permease protein
MKRFLARRLSIAIVQVWAVMTIVFFANLMTPGDPVLMMLGTDTAPDPAVVARLRTEMGLDQPVPIQYLRWIGRLARGDLGKSYSERERVAASISWRLPRTLELAVISMSLACLIGIPLGIKAALRRGKASDLVLTIIASIGNSIPVYVLGYLIVVVFALKLRLFPASGYTDFLENPAGHLLKLALPACTLALGLAASIMRMTRSSMLEALSSESVRALRAKGLPEKLVIRRHVIRNAMIPVVTIIGLQLGNLIGGTVLCEYVFNWPGLATLLVKAIGHRDYPLIQGCVFVMSAVFIFANLLVDILYGMIDPRARVRST